MIILIVSALLIAGVIVAGCTQNNGSASSQPSGDQASQVTTHSVPAGDANQQTLSNGRASSGSSRQYPGGNFLSNATRITAAAATLGVSEQDLKSALNISMTGRQNFTAAAQQLGVTQDQLTAALGISSGGQGFRGNRNATVVQTSSQ